MGYLNKMETKIRKQGKNIVLEMSKRKAKMLCAVGDYSLTIRDIFVNAPGFEYSEEDIRKLFKEFNIVLEIFFDKEKEVRNSSQA